MILLTINIPAERIYQIFQKNCVLSFIKIIRIHFPSLFDQSKFHFLAETPYNILLYYLSPSVWSSIFYPRYFFAACLIIMSVPCNPLVSAVSYNIFEPLTSCCKKCSNLQNTQKSIKGIKLFVCARMNKYLRCFCLGKILSFLADEFQLLA